MGQMAAPAPSLSLKDYLKKYDSGAVDPNKGKNKKKKKKASDKPLPGVVVVDQDPVWQKPVEIEDAEAESSGEEMALVEEDVEVKRMKRLQEIRSRKPYHGISDDGSGWIAVSEPSRYSNSDFSPPRRRSGAAHDTPTPATEDLSPPRKSFRDSEDLCLPRKAVRASEDLSPPRRRNSFPMLPEVDLSPPRRSRDLRESSSAPALDFSPPRKKRDLPVPTVNERRSGLISGKELKEEIKNKKKEELMRYAEIHPHLSGQAAEKVFRDKEGRRLSKEEMIKLKEDEKPKEKKLEWGKGLAQKREAESKAREMELEIEKPFARSRDDPELDKMLKERVRWGDPMAHLVKRKEANVIFEDLGMDEKMKESGFIIPQNVPNHSWIKRGLDFPPNRYGIRPGRHWDGVDRSNGYEKDMFKRQNEQQATQSEAYLWSVADM